MPDAYIEQDISVTFYSQTLIEFFDILSVPNEYMDDDGIIWLPFTRVILKNIIYFWKVLFKCYIISFERDHEANPLYRAT